MTPPPQVPYIGSTISLLSKANIRYEGFLYTIDQKESSVALSHVKVFGTEDRHSDRPVPPSDEIFEFIIFRASDITELKVIDTPPSRSVPDPAIIRAQNKVPSASGNDKEASSSSIKDFFSQVGNHRQEESRSSNRNYNSGGNQKFNRPPRENFGQQQNFYRGGNGNGNYRPRGGRGSYMPRNQQFQGGSYAPQGGTFRRNVNFNNSYGNGYNHGGYHSNQYRQNYRRSFDHPQGPLLVDPLMGGGNRRGQGRPVMMHFRRNTGPPPQRRQNWSQGHGYGNGGGTNSNFRRTPQWGTGSFSNGNSGYYQHNHVDPIPPRFTVDYDFEIANKEIETELAKLLVADPDTCGKFVGYNKEKSFYDDISRVAEESEDARKEAAKQANLNRETFGLVRGRMRRGFGAQHQGTRH